MRFVGELVGEVLDDGDVFMMPRQRLQPRRQLPVRAGLSLVRKPGLLRDAPAEAEENHALRRGGGLGRCEGFEADGFEGGQCDERAGAAEEVAAAGHGLTTGVHEEVVS